MSIIENVLMREITDRETDEALAVKALRFSGLYNKVAGLPNGIYTKLTREFSNQGTLLSGGEMQKLAISRVYARECGIVILDEPSSSLDPIAENEMFNAMLNLSKGKTVILISHRLANVRNVDKIYLLADGEIIEEGSHRELMERGGKYANMYQIQADRFS